ncbi:nucleotidyltransferase domain-containing protein [Candidatus Bathyarchaeota archaeon]|nr:nucleotidyltransferase domain-containing protein [Candidatus Bathyarchaeota archaeon]
MMRHYKYYKVDAEGKGLIIEKTRTVVEREGVPLAILFGSFVELDAFRDVDVAVYLKSLELNHLFRLVCRLEEELGLPVDVVPLNTIPPKFRQHILLKGKVILEKHLGLYEALIMQTLDEMALLGER